MSAFAAYAIVLAPVCCFLMWLWLTNRDQG